MTWQELVNEGKIERRQTSPEEIEEIREAVERDLKDAEVEYLSADRQFTIAYSAALLSAKMVIRCSGYRVRGHGAHYITFECLKLAMGKPIYKIAKFLNQCRKKRNIADYDAAGRITDTEADEMIKVAKVFSKKVEKWIRNNHPKLLK